MADTGVRFAFTDFHDKEGIRVFAFDKIAEDRSRQAVTVEVDLSLGRRYGIRLQELPLLCRSLLERSDHAGSSSAFVFAESEMLSVREVSAQMAASKARKSNRVPVGNRNRSTWGRPALPVIGRPAGA